MIRLDPPRVSVAAGMPLAARVASIDGRQVITVTQAGHLVGDFTALTAITAAGIDLADIESVR